MAATDTPEAARPGGSLRSHTPRPIKRRRRRLRAFSLFRMALLLFVYLLSFAAATLYFVATSINAELPRDFTALLDYQPNRKSVVLSQDGEEVGAFSIENRRMVPLERMPPHLPAAFL